MKQEIFTIKENVPLTKDIMKMRLEGDVSEIKGPGQFVNVKLDGLFLRRPISVCDVEGDCLTIIYKVVGKGTEKMAQMEEGTLDILTGLGNGYDLSCAGDAPLLVGGGVGVPPMYLLAKKLREEGKSIKVILGFNTASEVFYEEEFKELGADVKVTTVDGSYGIKGFVTKAMENMDYSYFYSCGPEAMLKSVSDISKTEGQLSFEERMACGFGACMGCSCKTLYGDKRICKDGPVLRKEEVIWQK